MRALGAKVLVVSNASGGLNPIFEKGDIMLIDDHINLMCDNPLRGPNDESLGPRFPDMSRTYDPEYIRLAEKIAIENGIKVQKGVYLALAGPNFETRAEYRFLRTIGADAVGMSTVPEVIVAIHSGMKVLGISIISDMGLPDALKPLTAEEVIEIGSRAEPKMTKIVVEFIAKATIKERKRAKAF
jgi:purine-nucleoside phosphorylase